MAGKDSPGTQPGHRLDAGPGKLDSAKRNDNLIAADQPQLILCRLRGDARIHSNSLRLRLDLLVGQFGFFDAGRRLLVRSERAVLLSRGAGVGGIGKRAEG